MLCLLCSIGFLWVVSVKPEYCTELVKIHKFDEDLALKVIWSIREVTGSHIKTKFFKPAYVSNIAWYVQDNKSLFYGA